MRLILIILARLNLRFGSAELERANAYRQLIDEAHDRADARFTVATRLLERARVAR